MNTSVGGPDIGQWYARTDKGEQFQVVGRDDGSRTIEIQSFDGEVDEIDVEAWGTLPLERIELPQDWCFRERRGRYWPAVPGRPALR